MSPKELEKVIYFAAYLITGVDTEKRHKDLAELEDTMRQECQVVQEEFDEWKKARLERLEVELAADGRGRRQEPGDLGPSP